MTQLKITSAQKKKITSALNTLTKVFGEYGDLNLNQMNLLLKEAELVKEPTVSSDFGIPD